MSQVSIVDIEHNNPQIPTRFNANVNFAIPIANVLEIYGSSVAAGSVPVYTVGSGNNITTNVQRSQAIASTDSTKVGLAAFNSANFTVDANGFVSLSAASGVQTITGNTGGAISPTAGNINIITANSTVKFAGVGSTETLDFGLSNIFLGASGSSIAGATANACLGLDAGKVVTSGSNNILIGHSAGLKLTTGFSNVAIGFQSLSNYTSGAANAGANVAVGIATLANLSTGISNLALGPSSGNMYTGSESSNLLLNSPGVLGESNTIRIGDQGILAGQQNRAFIAGITGVTISSSAPVAIDVNGQLSSLGTGTIGQVLVSTGTTSPTWQSVSSAGAITTITGNSGGAQSPSSGNFNILGAGSITSVGTANTETIQLTGLTNHAILVGAGTSTITKLALGSAGQVLQSGGASADPAWSTATYPSTGGTTGTILRSNGTNFLNTSATYPNTTTANQILYSSASNTIGEITTANNGILSTNGSGVPSIGNSLSNDYTFTTSTAGGNRIVTVSNTDNTNTSSNALQAISVGGTSAGDPFNRYVIGTVRSYSEGIDNSDSQSFVLTTISNQTATPSSGVVLERMTTGGNKTLPLNSSASPNLSSTIPNATGDGTLVSPVIFNSALFDQNGNYNTTTGIFTAPVTGKYLITSSITLTNLSGAHSLCELRIIAAGSIYTNFFNPGAIRDSNNVCTIAITRLVAMTAASTAQIDLVISGGTKTVNIALVAFTSATSLGINLLN